MESQIPKINICLNDSVDESLSPVKTQSAPKRSPLEEMRSKVKNSLFDRRASSSSPEKDPALEAQLTQLRETLTTKAADSKEAQKSNFERFRNFCKGSLTATNQLSCQASDFGSASPYSNKGLLSAVTPTVNGDSGLKLFDCNDDGVSSRNASDKGFAKEDENEGEEELIEVVTISRRLSPVKYQKTYEEEIMDLKEDLGVDDNSNVYFIKGDFERYYEEEEILGEGTSGTVKKCIKIGTKNKEKFAVKIVNYKGDLELLTLIVKEFKHYTSLNHKHIIRVYEQYIDYIHKKIYTVMELAECKEMFEVLQNLGNYSEEIACGIFMQILSGINYLHTCGVCHRDLKPNNILVSDDGKTVKITDFNVSKFTEDKSKKYSSLSTENCKMYTATGTIAFTAPEVFSQGEYTEAVDMWSAGVVLYTMLCGYQPFYEEYVQDLIAKITAGKVEFPEDPWNNISELAQDLIRKCLDPNPKTRFLPSDALMHPWITLHGKIAGKHLKLTVDYLRLYVNKSKRKEKRFKTRVPEKNLKILPDVIRNRSKRAGTTYNKIDMSNLEEAESPTELEMKHSKSAGMNSSPTIPVSNTRLSKFNKPQSNPAHQIEDIAEHENEGHESSTGGNSRGEFGEFTPMNEENYKNLDGFSSQSEERIPVHN